MLELSEVQTLNKIHSESHWSKCVTEIAKHPFSHHYVDLGVQAFES